MKHSQLVSLLQATIPAHHPVLIKGQPGIGKTDGVVQACQAVGARLIISHPVVSNPIDYKGFPVYDPQTKEAHFVAFSDLKELITADNLTVFFLDDLGQAPPVVQAAVMQLLLARRINGHKVSDHVCFVAATNRKMDKAGVSGILEPVKSRFKTIVEIESDHEEWIDWAIKFGNMPASLVAFIKYAPDMLNKYEPTSDIINTPCPRTVANVGHLQQTPTIQGSAAEFECYSGAAGQEFAGKYMGFLRVWRELPDPQVIINDPERAQIPEQPDIMYALCGSLAFRADKKNFGNICKYALRIPGEFSVFLIMSALRRDRELMQCAEFNEWAIVYSKILLESGI